MQCLLHHYCKATWNWLKILTRAYFQHTAYENYIIHIQIIFLNVISSGSIQHIWYLNKYGRCSCVNIVRSMLVFTLGFKLELPEWSSLTSFISILEKSKIGQMAFFKIKYVITNYIHAVKKFFYTINTFCVPISVNASPSSFSITGGVSADGSKIGSDDQNDGCITDWLTIPCATNTLFPFAQSGTPGVCVDRICGMVFNSVVTAAGSPSVPVYSRLLLDSFFLRINLY